MTLRELGALAEEKCNLGADVVALGQHVIAIHWVSAW
jgi:hypothetical protein